MIHVCWNPPVFWLPEAVVSVLRIASLPLLPLIACYNISMTGRIGLTGLFRSGCGGGIRGGTGADCRLLVGEARVVVVLAYTNKRQSSIFCNCAFKREVLSPENCRRPVVRVDHRLVLTVPSF